MLQALISAAVVDSYNALTIDGDTSTSDTVLLFATGKAAERGQTPITDAADPALAGFRAALESLTLELAQWVAKGR